MKDSLRLFASASSAIATLFLAGCAGQPQGIQGGPRSAAAAASIQSEAPGDYYIGRRYYNQNFKFWGYVRKPGQPWSTAQLVMMNEQQKLAPDREINKLGSDNNHEYRLQGGFSGEKVYEPASNGFYPEFVLQKYDLISAAPPPIFRSQYDARAQAAVRRLTIEKPE